MQKKNIFNRLKVLSRPTGKPQWAQATRSIILIVLAALITKFLGLDNGLQAVMFITLLATIIMDINLPIRKVVPLAILGFIMTILAFTSASLGLSSVPVFLFFTVIWSFFALSTYIFGESVGFFGFIIFSMYFISVLMVNNKSTTSEWVLYCLIAFLVASILLVPRFFQRKQELREMIAVGFQPQSSLKIVLTTRKALSGTPLNTAHYQLFRLGSYMAGFREYSKLLYLRISSEYQERFREFLQVADDTSLQIANGIRKDKDLVNLRKLNEQLSNIDRGIRDHKERDLRAFVDIAYQMGEVLKKSADLLHGENFKKKIKISLTQTSLKEVLKVNFNLQNMYIRHALRFTLAMTIGLLLVHITHNRDVIWVTMGILIIIKPDITSTINNMIMRISFNLLAIVSAILLGFIFPHEILIWLAFIMLFFFRAFFPTYMGLSVMALTIFVVFVWPTGTVLENAVARIIDISLGAIIAFICAYLILPSRVTVDLPGQAARTIKANKEYMKSVLINPNNYCHDDAVKGLNNYLLEDINLEAAISKLRDFFTEVSEDISIYQDLKAANQKLSADISALANFFENEKQSLNDVSVDNQPLIDVMDNLSISIENETRPVKTYVSKPFPDLKEISYEIKNLEQYLDWIISDIELIEEIVDSAFDKSLFQKYRNLT